MDNARGRKAGYHHGDLRRALLRAAEQELTEKGLEGFTLRGCARRAGVSHAAPAHHFKDASALLAALAAEGFERFIETVRKRSAQQPANDPVARLVGSGLGYVDFARENPALFRLMFSSSRPDYGDEHLVAVAAAAFGDLVTRVGEATGSDPLSTQDGRQRVAAVWAMAHGLADLTLSRRMTFLDDDDPAIRDRNLAAVLRLSLAQG